MSFLCLSHALEDPGEALFQRFFTHRDPHRNPFRSRLSFRAVLLGSGAMHSVFSA